MKIIKSINNYLEEVILVMLSILMVSVTFLQVVMRTFGNSLSWSEELARFTFIWMVYIGIAYGVKKMKHISIDALLLLFKGKYKLILPIVSNVFFIAFSIVIIIYGYEVSSILLGFGQTSAALGIPIGFVYLATPVGFGLTLIRLIQNLIIQIKDFINFDQLPNDKKQEITKQSIS
ncbi:TRAP transporter small permease [Oceanobacillus sp. CFH 90083]|uniref:TRAP transporter small permease n=1 Tax=Oceanobacillus sp. CFH 90083 TaxID=2592336 RepID=UPI00128D4FCB|nr:TRAP transporter small permease [Oceanobacillus sp. CFH 90083]